VHFFFYWNHIYIFKYLEVQALKPYIFLKYDPFFLIDVFRRFKEENGKFKESLIEDARGMLSLYEAAHLGTTTDYILDEALDFASNNLVSLAEDGMCPSHLSTHIRNALSISQHWNMEIIVAVQYIRFYEQEVGHDEMLLKFAKLNFNLVQRLYLQEVKILTKYVKISIIQPLNKYSLIIYICF